MNAFPKSMPPHLSIANFQTIAPMAAPSAALSESESNIGKA